MLESRNAPFHVRVVPTLVLCIAAGVSLAACSTSSTHAGTSTGGAGGATATTSTTTTPDECPTLCATETTACPETSTACVAGYVQRRLRRLRHLRLEAGRDELRLRHRAPPAPT